MPQLVSSVIVLFYRALDYKAAAAAFKIAATADPTMFAAQHNLGISHVKLGDFEDNCNNGLSGSIAGARSRRLVLRR